jgi:hypothetical protein
VAEQSFKIKLKKIKRIAKLCIILSYYLYVAQRRYRGHLAVLCIDIQIISVFEGGGGVNECVLGTNGLKSG